jgi:hypothetical protein
LTYQPPASSTFLSEQTSHQQPANNTFLSQQISTSHQPPAKRTGCVAQVNQSTPRSSSSLDGAPMSTFALSQAPCCGCHCPSPRLHDLVVVSRCLHPPSFFSNYTIHRRHPQRTHTNVTPKNFN